MAVKIGISAKKENLNHRNDEMRFHFVYQDGKFSLEKEALFPEPNKALKGYVHSKSPEAKTRIKKNSKHAIFTNRRTRAFLSLLVIASGALGHVAAIDPTLPAGVLSAGFNLITNSLDSSQGFFAQELAKVRSFVDETIPPESMGLMKGVTASLMVGQVPLLNAKLR